MGHTDFSDHQEQGTPARYAFHHRVRLSDTCGKHAVWLTSFAPSGHAGMHSSLDGFMHLFSIRIRFQAIPEY